MKRSNAFLLSGVLFVALIAVGGVLAFRLIANGAPEPAGAVGPGAGRLLVESPGASDQRTLPTGSSVSLDFGATQTLECSGSWKVVLVDGPEGRAKLTMPSRSEFQVRAQTANGRLQLSLTDTSGAGWSGDQALVEICLPRAKEFRASGSSNLVLNGIQTEELALYLSGASSVAGSGRVRELSLFVSGSSSADLSPLVAQKIDVDASGAGNLVVKAEGGPVAGHLSGVVALKVEGTPSEVRVETSGLSSVTRN